MTQAAGVAHLAGQMLRDYDAHTPGTPFANGLRLSVEEAYQLQKQVAQLRESRGERVVGYKIGCVCQGNQESNGLSHPVYGRLWSSEQYVSEVALATSEFSNVAIEGELAISLRKNVDASDASIPAIAAAVDRVFPVIELHNLVLHGDRPTGAELIGNNAIHAGVVRSAGTRPPKAPVCTDLSVVLDGRTVAHWSDRRWPEDILKAVPWLVVELERDDRQLMAGQTILTGSWGPPLPLERRASPGTPPGSPFGWNNVHADVAPIERQVVSRVNVLSSLFGEVRASFSAVDGVPRKNIQGT